MKRQSQHSSPKAMSSVVRARFTSSRSAAKTHSPGGLERLRAHTFRGNLQPLADFFVGGDEFCCGLKGMHAGAGAARRPAGRAQSKCGLIPRSWSRPIAITVSKLGEDLYAELGYPRDARPGAGLVCAELSVFFSTRRWRCSATSNRRHGIHRNGQIGYVSADLMVAAGVRRVWKFLAPRSAVAVTTALTRIFLTGPKS